MISIRLAGAVAAALMACSAQAQPLDMTLSGGSPGGLWSLLGAGIDRAVKADDASSVVTYQATGGGFANIGLLASGRTDLGLVHDAEAKIALRGDEPFRGPIENLRSIGYLYNWAPMHFFLEQGVAEEYGIDSLDDIAASGAPIRIGVNRSGNITGDVALFMLAQAGATEEAIEANGGQIVRSGSSEQADLMQDGRIDMVTNGIFVLHSSFRAIDENTDVVLLEVPAAVIDATNEAFGTARFTVPAASYSAQPDAIETVALGALLAASEAMDEATAHSLAASLVAHVDDVRAVHSAMGQLSTALLATPSVLTFHPGAMRAYREAGLIE